MYGFLIFIGIIISLFYAELITTKEKLNQNVFWKLVFWGMLFGIIGARIYHVINFWELYSRNPIYIIAIWNGGMGIYGGIALALLVIWKLERKDFLKWTDIFVRVLPLGQAIGRWGNYFNNELLPFAIYESFLDIILFGFINTLALKKPQAGVLSKIYLIGYALIRFLLENYRADHWILNGINITKLASLVIIFITLLTLWPKQKIKK